MVRHIVAWSFQETLTEGERSKHTELIKKELESLKNVIPGIVSIDVITKPLSTSDSDLMLDCVLENEEALKNYQVHPEHVRVASTYVRPVTCNRKCLDFTL